jgi:hypothetical protein
MYIFKRAAWNNIMHVDLPIMAYGPTIGIAVPSQGCRHSQIARCHRACEAGFLHLRYIEQLPKLEPISQVYDVGKVSSWIYMHIHAFRVPGNPIATCLLGSRERCRFRACYGLCCRWYAVLGGQGT